MSTIIRKLDAGEARRRISELSDILLDCVAGGASVSFMAGMTRDESDAFWSGVIDDVAQGGRDLIVAETNGRLDGAVQSVFIDKPNQPHRAEVAKMLVHRRARGGGVGLSLLKAAEDAALAKGRWLMVLDTVSRSAGDRLYRRGGWTEAGEVPNYALMPDGALCPTTFFYKDLRPKGHVA
ncbi:GNAT family N-acetyltransferase [Terrarubrum flagellatum]|uniref:GNAT family N-acetyltransferase n=1 Tax=Terrirubrum flagellatum TaxID=2895980 RepID=UPI0031450B67